MLRRSPHRGARWFRCDFQVHTPRDRQWQGARPTESERRTWADDLVKAARAANLNGIAITDHHDLVTYPYVREAASEELDGDGNPVPEPDRLVVFPGLELTLAVPCQALLLFDADIPLEHLGQLPGALGYEQSPTTDDRTAETKPLSINDLNDVLDRLDAFSYLRGRYILLPHVKDGGHQTLLRSGFSQHYRKFRGCGGYTDGDVPRVDSGVASILAGRDSNYGNKALAVFQTSDSRRSDFGKLGRHSTWVKWSEPTAEALRQSCLARNSRISQTEPKDPAIVITRIEITASRFLGKQNFFLSPQYTAIIGGRGTGKSTLLEYAKWALCAQAPRHAQEQPQPDYERRSQALIERTLSEVKGAVRIEVDVRGVQHVVERRTDSELHLVIKVGDGEFRESDEAEIRRLIPVEAYSQKQLSTVGGTTEDVLTFLLAPVASEVSDLSSRLQSASDEVRESFARMRTLVRSLREAAALRKERDSLAQQKAALAKQFAALDPADAAILRSADGYAAERAVRERWSNELTEARASFAALLAELDRWPSPPPVGSLPDATTVSSMHASLAAFFKQLRDDADRCLSSFDSSEQLVSYRDEDAKLGKSLDEARERFKGARERAKAHESAIKETEKLSTRLTQIDARLAELGDVQHQYDAAFAKYEQCSSRRLDILREKSAVTDARCRSIELDSGGIIRGTARPGANLSQPVSVLTQVAKGSRLRGDRFDSLGAFLDEQPDPLEAWRSAVEELRRLLEVRDEDATLPPAPVLYAAGFSDKDLRALAKQLDDESWLRVRLSIPDDAVSFDYKSREGDYIPFTQASAGQRATALMRVLLANEGVPLLVDQPEDDLDNKVIQEIAADIWVAKSRRQLLFASHNANLVVNGDADLVAVFDYEVAGEQTSGVIKALGSIDAEPVRTAIAEVMEGGPTAFQLRKDKYGF